MQVEEPVYDDGTFWMAFDDFRRHFTSISVCMAHVPPPIKPPGTSRPLAKARPEELAMWPDVHAALGAPAGVRTAGCVVRRKSLFALEPRRSAAGVAAPAAYRAQAWFTLRVEAAADAELVCCMIGLHQVRLLASPSPAPSHRLAWATAQGHASIQSTSPPHAHPRLRCAVRQVDERCAGAPKLLDIGLAVRRSDWAQRAVRTAPRLTHHHVG